MRKSAAGRSRKGICVIGMGNWGSSLAAAVVRAGIPLVEVVVRSVEGRSARRAGLSLTTLDTATLDAEVLWICVPDGEIASVAEQIATRRGDLQAQTVIHSSGALTVAALEPVRLRGAAIGGIAPIFSFPARVPVALDGVMFMVETAAGSGLPDGRKLTALVRKLGGSPVRISSGKKVFYHAAATMASPLLVSALHAAVAAAKLSGLSGRQAAEVVGALAKTTMTNYFEKGSGGSFSGAFARGDSGTVELHLQALLAHPMLHGVYRALARNALASLPVRNGTELKQVLDDADEG